MYGYVFPSGESLFGNFGRRLGIDSLLVAVVLCIPALSLPMVVGDGVCIRVSRLESIDIPSASISPPHFIMSTSYSLSLLRFGVELNAGGLSTIFASDRHWEFAAAKEAKTDARC